MREIGYVNMALGRGGGYPCQKFRASFLCFDLICLFDFFVFITVATDGPMRSVSTLWTVGYVKNTAASLPSQRFFFFFFWSVCEAKHMEKEI